MNLTLLLSELIGEEIESKKYNVTYHRPHKQ
jgi:hypothetical protein